MVGKPGTAQLGADNPCPKELTFQLHDWGQQMGRDGRRRKQWDTGRPQIPAAYPLSNTAKLKFHSLIVRAEVALFLPH